MAQGPDRQGAAGIAIVLGAVGAKALTDLGADDFAQSVREKITEADQKREARDHVAQ